MMNALVVGAGPAGSFVSYLLAKHGIDVTLIEEHSQVGLPVQCTGIVTSMIEELVKLPSSIVKNRINRARIFAPNKEFVEIDIQTPNIILDRSSFDKFLAEKAQEAGAELLLSHRFVGHEDNKVIVKDIVKNKLRHYTPDIIIGADGPNSSIAKSYGLYEKRSFLLGAQARVKMKGNDAVDFYPAPEGIFWSVPEGNGIYRIGVAVYHNPSETLQRFLSMHSNKRIIDYQGGLIPLYDSAIPIEQNNVYLIGDAAAQVKATTAGGIVQSLVAAKCLAHSIVTGENYTSTVKKTLGRELWLHLKLRQVMNRFSVEDYNSLVAYTNNPKIRQMLAANDRDKLFSFFFKMLFYEPRYLKFIPHLFW